MTVDWLRDVPRALSTRSVVAVVVLASVGDQGGEEIVD